MRKCLECSRFLTHFFGCDVAAGSGGTGSQPTPANASSSPPTGVGAAAAAAAAAAAQKKNTSRRNAWGNLSYADLITQAIASASDNRLTLSQIYEWMVQNVPYFKDKGDSNSSAGWKVSDPVLSPETPPTGMRGERIAD